MTTKISILGSGAMATACSILLAERDDQSVSMWARSPDQARDLTEHRENRRLLPNVRLPDKLEISSDIDEAVWWQPFPRNSSARPSKKLPAI